jgi:aminomethyltransferase
VTADSSILRTALHEEHVRLGARMAPFAGWEMPIQYQGVMAEHAAVRNAAGLFDVSHMGEVEISGPQAEAFLDRLTPNAVSRLATGQAHYTALLTPEGTFIDDLLIYRLASGRFLLVVNAANAGKDLEWIQEQADDEVEVLDVSHRYALLALQGPRAAAILGRALERDVATLRSFHFTVDALPAGQCLVSRTGYTGEDGFEIYLPPEEAPAMWRKILAAGQQDGVVPVGLGARDTLRLEAALPLYGQDIDADHTPLAAGVKFIVKMDKGDFIGRDALVRQQQEGLQERLTGFAITGRGIARHGHLVSVAGKVVGPVTSGTHSPTMKRAIGMAYLPMEHREKGTRVTVEIRGKEVEAEVVPLPFYRRPRPQGRSAG